MAAPAWQPGKLYAPGSLVVPRTAPATGPIAISNGSFETGDLSDWSYTTIGGSATLSVVASHPDTGVYAAYWPGGNGSGSESGIECVATSDDLQPITPGALITVSMRGNYNTTGQHDGSRFQARIQWYDSSGAPLSVSQGTVIKGRGNNNRYVTSTCSAVAPAGAAYVAAQWWATARGGHVYVDTITWNYVSSAPPPGLMFKAVQPATGYSDTTEPTWPTANGVQVVDNEVIWEAVYLTRLVWQARPLLVSGSVEPDWPEAVGATVPDNTISWEAVSRRVTDPKCPNSKYVTIAASKVFAADDDIIAYSATVNPLDWSSADNAGYLPFGLQMYGANPVKALGLYRGNVVALNAQGSQVWQVDEDPAQMAILDAFPLGTEYHHTLAPVSNDLFLLTAQGVRSVGIAGGATNLQADDVGEPIDPLVKAALRDAKTLDVEPMSLYNPNTGQYWLIFRWPSDVGGVDAEPDTTAVFCCTMNQAGKRGRWTRYLLPFPVDDWTILGSKLYLRGPNLVHVIDDSCESDEVEWIDGDPPGPADPVQFQWMVQWPWLDWGALGVTKMLQGFDIVGNGTCAIEFGYNQANGGLWTPAWELNADSVPGQLLPMPLSAPSLAVRLTFNGSDVSPTQWNALRLEFLNFRSTS